MKRSREKKGDPKLVVRRQAEKAAPDVVSLGDYVVGPPDENGMTHWFRVGRMTGPVHDTVLDVAHTKTLRIRSMRADTLVFEGWTPTRQVPIWRVSA